jgi:putative sterol carrier protein
MSVADDVQEIFDRMPEAFQADKAAGMQAVIQLHLTGDGGGNWTVNIANGQVKADKGEAASPDLTLEMEAKDYVALTRGDANPMNLFMAGKIKLQGDMTLAMKFEEIFSTG